MFGDAVAVGEKAFEFIADDQIQIGDGNLVVAFAADVFR
jgi:hypothetical protein